MNLRLELQVNVNLCGVQRHFLGAQDDVKGHLVKEANIRHNRRTAAKHQGDGVTRPPYLRVSFKGIPQLTVGLGAVLIGRADNLLLRLMKKRSGFVNVKLSRPASSISPRFNHLTF